ncbi:MAG: hypothetical protein WBP58_01220 [Chitinophagaceae bacterium]
MLKKYIRNKFLRISVYVLMTLMALYLIIHLVLAYRAKEIIRSIVSEQTDGKVDIKIGRVGFNLFPSTRLDLFNTQLIFLDSIGKNKIYDIQFKYLGLQVNSITDFLFRKKLQIDFLVAEDPHVQVSPSFKKRAQEGNKAVHFEIGTIYIALQKIAKEMQIKRFGLMNGKVTLMKLSPNQTTISIGGVNFTARDLSMAADTSVNIENKLQAGRINLNTGKQEINFPEGNYILKFNGLSLDTEEKLVSISDFAFIGQAKDSTLGKIEAGFRQFRMYNLDFWSLYNSGTLRIDSLICIDPTIKMGMDVSPKANKQQVSDLSIEKRITGITGKMDIKYLSLRNSTFDITTRNKDKIVPFHSSGNDFEAIGIRLDSSAERPINIDRVSFAIKNYTAVTSDSLYNINFDSVIFSNRSINLINFRISPSASNKLKAQKWLTVPNFQLNNISFDHLLSEKKLKADELLLENATVINNFVPKTKKAERPKPLRQILASLHKSIDLNKVTIRNSSVEMQSMTDKNKRMTLYGFNSEIALEEMFDASTYEIMGRSVGAVQFDSLHLRAGNYNVNFSDGEIRGKDRMITAKHMNLNNPSSGARSHAKDIKIHNYHFDDTFNEITVDSVTFSYASLHLRPQKSNRQTDKKALDLPNLKLNLFRGRDIKVDLNQGDSLIVKTHVNLIEGKGMTIQDEQLSITGFKLDMDSLQYQSPGVMARTGRINVIDEQASSISDLKVSVNRNGNSIKATVPAIRFIPAIAQTIEKKYPVIPSLEMDYPVVSARLGSNTKSKEPASKKPSSFQLGSMKIIQGTFDIHQQNGNKSLLVNTGKIDISLKDLKKDIDNTQIGLGETSIRSNQLRLNVNDSLQLFTTDGHLNIDIEKLFKAKGEDNGVFHANIKNIDGIKLNLHLLNKKGKEIEVNGFSLGGSDILLDSLSRGHVLRRMKNNPTLHAGDINFKKIDEKTHLEIFNIGFTNGNKTISIDSLVFHPSMDRDSFNRMQQWQKDYMQVATGKIRIRNFDFDRLAADSLYNAGQIEINHPSLHIYKDKRLPFQSGIIKPLPVDMLERVRQRIHLDSIRIINGDLTYEEFNDKTNSLGTINFTNLNARIRNIRNYETRPTDSLLLSASTMFLGKAPLSIRFRESYSDSLAGFLYAVNMGAMDLKELNAVIVPLASAKVTSGYLDTLQLKAIGREYIAHGKMKMLYRDLKVEFLNKKDQEKKTIVTRFISWVANGIIKRKNTSKTGSVYTARIRERSVFNYWIKIVLSGALTNAGIKSNSKQDKKYKKSVKKLHVPDIPDVEL